MRKVFQVAICTLVISSMSIPGWAQRKRPAPPELAVKVGEMAPDFTLRSHELKSVSLSDFRGKKTVVLAFYVLAFTGG